MQSKRLTTMEVLTNTFTGLLGSWLITVYFISGGGTPIATATVITVVCTIWSILREYVIRRIFNRIAHRPANVKAYFDESRIFDFNAEEWAKEKEKFHADIKQWEENPPLESIGKLFMSNSDYQVKGFTLEESFITNPEYPLTVTFVCTETHRNHTLTGKVASGVNTIEVTCPDCSKTLSEIALYHPDRWTVPKTTVIESHSVTTTVSQPV